MARNTFFRASVIQLCPTSSRSANLATAERLIDSAASSGSRLVVLPETFPCIYGLQHFPSNAEVLGEIGSASEILREAAKRNRIHVLGGVVERCPIDNNLYNTIPCYNPSGDLVAKYRKIHLSNVSIPQSDGESIETTCEKDFFSAGSDLSYFDIIEDEIKLRIGIGCCFDLRFQELSRAYAKDLACDVIAFPSAFLYSSGQYHWKLLLRSIALNNQVFTIGSNHGLNEENGEMKMFGNTAFANGWGEIFGNCASASGNAIVTADLDIEELYQIREMIPLNRCRADMFI